MEGDTMQDLIAYVSQNVTPFNVILLVLFIASEILGTVESVKASSLFGVGRKLLVTLKDEVVPQKTDAGSANPQQ
jgi:hypothetical protein